MAKKLPNDYSDSFVQLTDEQFEALERQNGRIVDLPLCYHVLTAGQVEELHEDDWSYYEELIEEERCLMAEAEADYNTGLGITPTKLF